MKHVIIAILVTLLAVSTSSAWLSGYDHRMPIEINNTGNSLSDHPYNFTVNTAALVASGNMTDVNGSDCRITNATDVLQEFWNETSFNDSSTKIWVNATSLGNITNTTHYMYYGQSGVSSIADGDATFTFFDGFEEASLDTDKWTLIPATSPYAWTQVAPKNGTNNDLIWGLVELNGKIYGSGGGAGGGALSEWNGVDKWIINSSTVGYMCPIILFNGKIYGAGAYSSDAAGANLYVANGTHWDKVADKLVANTDIQDIIEYNNTIWGICGKNAAVNDGGELYEWYGGQWVERAPTFRDQIYGKCLAVLGGELYGTTATNGQLLWYNESNSTWELKAPQHGSEIYTEEAYTYNGKIYAATGQTGLLLEWNGVDAWVAKTSQWGSNTHLITIIEWYGDLYGASVSSGHLLKWNGVDGWTQMAAKYGSETHLFSFVNFSGDLYAGTAPNGNLLKLGSSGIIDNGTIVLTGDGTANGQPKLIGKKDVGTNYVARFRAKVSATTAKWMIGMTDQTSASDNSYSTGDNTHLYPAADGNVYYYSSDNSASEGNIGTSAYDTSYHIWENVRNGSTSVIYLYDNILQGAHTTQVPDANMHIDIYSFGTQTTTLTCDWVFLYPFVITRPTTSLGAEEAAPSLNNIVLAANKYGMLRKNITSAETFSTISDGFAHDVCFTWWDDVTDTWLSYWVGDSYNSAQSIPEHESYFVLMDGTGETVSCSVAAAETVAIPIGWSVTYLRESSSKTLTAIKADMGGNCADLYAWDHTAAGTGAWTNTGAYSVLPNQGLLVSASAGFNWDGTVP